MFQIEISWEGLRPGLDVEIHVRRVELSACEMRGLNQ